MVLLVTFLKYVIYLRLCKGNSAATGKDSYGFTAVFCSKSTLSTQCAKHCHKRITGEFRSSLFSGFSSG